MDDQAPRSGDPAAGLSERQQAMLEFERTWWQFDEPRDELIAVRFACTTDEYYAELTQLLERPEAMAHDPLVVRRFQRRRVRRRRMIQQSQPGREAQSDVRGATHE
jgi:hypothetical protein